MSEATIAGSRSSVRFRARLKSSLGGQDGLSAAVFGGFQVEKP